MRKLAALVQHIATITKIPPENITAWAEGGDLRPMGAERAPLRPEDGEEGPVRRQIELGEFQYDGIIQIERYPGNGAEFSALVTTWLAENDSDRDGLDDPILDVDLNIKGGDSDVQLSIDFVERLEAIEDPHGCIPFDGLMWSLQPVVITPAEAGTVHAVNQGAGKCPR